MIEAKNLWKRYGDNVVLEQLNLKVAEGEFITMVGASGCGKSTFLNLLLGTQSATSGSLTLDNMPFPQEPGPDRGIVFQQYSVFPHKTVLDNLTTAKKLAKSGWTGWLSKVEKRATAEQALTLLDAVGLSHARDRYPHELSGGMRQRLAIAQALINRPRILLLDEPFGALDPGIRADMHDLVLDLWRRFSLTVFMVTHDLNEGFHLGTRLLVFDKIRVDEQSPNSYGATVTYDLPVGDMNHEKLKSIDGDLSVTAKFKDKLNV